MLQQLRKSGIDGGHMRYTKGGKEKNMKKQVIAVLTSLVLAATMIPAVAFADTAVTPPQDAATTETPITAKQLKQYIEQAEDYAVLVGNSPTIENLKGAVTFITDITSTDAAWTAAKANLQTAIAGAYKAKVDALSATITLKDMTAVQEIYLLKAAKVEEAAGDKLSEATKDQATLKIDALKTLIPTTEDESFTAAVAAAFKVTEASTVTFSEADKAKLDLGTDIFADEPKLAGASIEASLKNGLVDYDSAKSNYGYAKSKYEDEATKAKNSAVSFIKKVDALSSKDANDADYNVELDKATAEYNALNAQYKENGRLYKAVISSVNEKLSSVKDANVQLARMIEGANSDNAAILRELVEGIAKLPAPAELKLADKDVVYALQKRKGDLTETGKATFETTYASYSDKLDAAIAAMDKLVTDDVKAQIAALKALPANPTIKDIQAAKDANAAVRAAYEALTADQKKLVTNEADLKKAETAAFIAEAAYAKAEMNSFSKLDAANLTEDQAADILQLQELIGEMDKTYKEQVTADPAYKVFQELAAAAALMLNKNTNLESAVIEAIPAQTYTGKAITPVITVKDASGAVIDSANYDIDFDKNVNAGTATVKVKAKGSAYIGEKTATFTIKAVSLKSASITIANKTYTGKALKPAPTVKFKKNTLPKTDYKVTYKNNTKLGKATVTIKGTGNCTGTVTKTFLIKPAKATVTLVRSKTKKQITVSAKEQKTATVYQVLYNTKGTVNKTAKSAKRTITIKKLKSGKTYTVRMRVCKKIDGKNYWGAYSPVYKVKVR